MAAYSDAARDQAIAWFNRLQDPDFEEPGWVDFTAWLEVSPENRAAYDAVEAVWLGFEPLPQAKVIPIGLRRRAERPMLRYAAAAALAVAVFGGAGAYLYIRPAPAVTYTTAADQIRTIDLADGSRVLLDRGSALTVAFERGVRHVELTRGEANFSVAHDAARPFVVMAGRSRVQVVGTEFDVLRQTDRLRVTVTRGRVDVGPSGGERRDFSLTAGDQLDQREGAAGVVRKVEPGIASSWRKGMLVYQAAPLQDVAADLGRYLATPVRLGPGAEALSFSGVLRIADGQAMVDRLEAFLPLEVKRVPDGVVLNRRGS